MRSNKLLISVLLAAVALTSVTALGFEAYFSHADGSKITEIWEGRSVHVAVEDPYKVACGIDSFAANVLIFDYKTGAYREVEAQFIEMGYAEGIFVWDQGAIPIGDRANWEPISYEYPHQLADRTLREELALGFEHVTDNLTRGPGTDGRWWMDGNWEYIDQQGSETTIGANTGVPQRYQFEELGRFENHDTLVVLVEDLTDGFWGAGQMKIKRTEAELSTSIEEVYYGCSDIIVEIDDRDESLSSDRPDFVPFFVIVNPGSWNVERVDNDVPPPPDDDMPPPPPTALQDDPPPPPPDDPDPDPDPDPTPAVAGGVNNFCALMQTGGVDPTREVGDGVAAMMNDPIRWYNIYDLRYIQYPFDADATDTRPDGWNWAPAPDPAASTDNVPASLIAPDGERSIERLPGVARATFYAQETGPNTGVFRFNFGSLDQLQKRLGFQRFPAGTTIAFYYVDPNDFSDMAVTTIHVASPYTRSRVEITDAHGNKVDEVRLGEDGLYFRVEDTKQNMDDCLQESVLVHVCDVHGEDDSEYWKLDEVLGPAGVFAHSGAMRLEPVWDAVGGYQLVLDDQKFQGFNADTIFVRYNSVRYNPDHVGRLGAGVGALDDKDHFPPEIIDLDPRFVDDVDLPYYAWDVSFDTVQVYDYQVFDGTRTTMRLMDGRFQPIEERAEPYYRPSDEIYLEVTDLDQNEDSRVAERISGRWDRPVVDSSPVWGAQQSALADFLGRDFEREDPAKVFVFNPRTGQMRALDLMETGRDTGVFRSTTGLRVSDLGGMENDPIVAFYQDPSNHHDIAIVSVLVKGGPVAPVDEPSVSFDRGQYARRDTGTITVTEPQMAGQSEITGEDVLVLKDRHGDVVLSWDTISAVGDERFQVEFTVPEDIATGTIRAVYTHPTSPERTAEATAQVIVAELENVFGITIEPEFLETYAEFRLDAEPAGAVADAFTITFYSLTGRKVGEVSGTDTDTLTWDGGNLRSSAYMYVAVVEGPDDQWVFRGPVYIRR